MSRDTQKPTARGYGGELIARGRISPDESKAILQPPTDTVRRVVLSAMTQAHVFQLARAMIESGQLELLLSGYPKRKLNRMGLPSHFLKSISTPVLAWMAFNRLTKNQNMQVWSEPWPKVIYDFWAARVVPKCDLFLATSSVGLLTGRRARSEGALWVCDRPCSHILTQDELLSEEYKLHGLRWPGIHTKVIQRELAEYEEADAVLVASSFAQRSFLEKGFSTERLWTVPYGVDLQLFKPDGLPEADGFTVLFVGQRSLRKGVGYLLAAFERLRHPRKRLRMVGTDTPDSSVAMRGASTMSGVEVMPSMPQGHLKTLMASSDVLVLPSIEDGYGMVVDQAMACGCPCVVSRNAGAADVVQEGVNGLTFEARDVDALTEALQTLADDRQLRVAMREKARTTALARGDWASYAKTLTDLAGRARGCSL